MQPSLVKNSNKPLNAYTYKAYINEYLSIYTYKKGFIKKYLKYLGFYYYAYVSCERMVF